MAATVRGAFEIIDRASATMVKMEAIAKKTDMAIKNLGDDLDKIGSKRQHDSINKTVKQVDSLGRAHKTLGGETRSLTRDFEKLDRKSGTLRRGIKDLAASFVAMKGIIGLLKIPAMIAGFGLLIKGVGALGAGLVSLLPKMTDLVGLSEGLVPLYGGLGLALGTAKLAFSGLSQAMHGNKKALQALTPEGRRFLDTLKGAKKELTGVQRSAQQGLFPGLDSAIQTFQSGGGFGVARGLAKQTGRRMGDVAKYAAQTATQTSTKGLLKDFGDQSSLMLERAGKAAILLGKALLYVVKAARPFNDWLGKGVLSTARHIEATARLAQENGRLGRFFDRTKDAMKRMWSIGVNLFNVMKNIGHAARPLGDDLYKDFDKLTKKWADFTGSARGQMGMAMWFSEMKAPLYQLLGLVGDLSAALFRLTRPGPGTTGMIVELRKMVPTLEHLIQTITIGFGPPLISALTQIAQLFETLVMPIPSFAKMIEMMAKFVNFLVTKVPGVKQALTGLIAIMTFQKVFGPMGRLRSMWRGLAGDIGGATVASRNFGAAQAGAAGGAAAGGGGAMVMPFGTGRGTRPGFRQNYSYLREGGMNRRASMGMALAEGGALAGLGGAGRLARGAAKFALPAALAFGAIDYATAEGGFNERMQAAMSGATFGLIPSPLSSASSKQNASNAYQQGLMNIAPARGIRGMRGSSAVLKSSIRGVHAGRALGFAGVNGGDLAQLYGMHSNLALSGKDYANFQKMFGKGGRDLGNVKASDWKAIEDSLRRQLALQQRQTAEMVKQRRLMLDQQAVRSADLRSDPAGLSKSWHKYSMQKGGAGGASVSMLADFQQGFSGLRGAGKKQLAQNYEDWARAMAQKNPKLKKVVDDLNQQITSSFARMGKHVEIVNGKVLTGSTSEWQQIAASLGSSAENAQARVGKAFDAIQRQALGSLISMGFSAGDAKRIVQGGTGASASASTFQGVAQAGASGALAHTGKHGGGKHIIAPSSGSITHPKAAGGMRIPGRGVLDTVPLMGAPGELVINGNTEGRVNTMLSKFGTSLGNEVGTEKRPHSMMSGDRIGGVGGGGGIGHPELKSGVRDAAAAVLAHFPGLAITSTTGGTHAKNSWHYKGMAVDIGGAPALMNQAAAWIASTMGGSLTEGIHNPNLSIAGGKRVPPSYWGATTWAGHADHIHLALAGALAAMGAGGGGGIGGMGGMGSVSLKNPLAAGGGVPGMLAHGAAGAMAAGLSQKINGALGGGNFGGSFTGGGKGRMNASQLSQLWIGAGGPAGIAGLMARVAMAESGGNPGAHNPSGASGLWQILGLPFPGNPMDPATNARMAVWKYQHQGLGAWAASRGAWGKGMSKGGRVPWFGAGADFIAKRPQLIGVGDGGEERVKVIPKGGKGGGGGGPLVGQLVIHAVGGKDIELEVYKALTKVMHEASRQGLYDESESGVS